MMIWAWVCWGTLIFISMKEPQGWILWLVLGFLMIARTSLMFLKAPKMGRYIMQAGKGIKSELSTETLQKVARAWKRFEDALPSSHPALKIVALDGDGCNAMTHVIGRDSWFIGVTKDGLEKWSEDELLAVFGHEWGHVVNGDDKKMSRLVTWLEFKTFLPLLSLSLFFGIVSSLYGLEAFFFAPVIVMTAFVLGKSAFFKFIEEMHLQEHAADLKSLEISGNWTSLASALRFVPQTGFMHPPVDERKKRLWEASQSK